jgi:hypothetical protein
MPAHGGKQVAHEAALLPPTPRRAKPMGSSVFGDLTGLIVRAARAYSGWAEMSPAATHRRDVAAGRGVGS